MGRLIQRFPFVIFFISLLTAELSAQELKFPLPADDLHWADSVLQTLTTEEKIGQLIFVRANKENQFIPEIPDLIKKYNIGGVVFFKSSPVRVANTINLYQSLARTPVMVALDAERGLAMRFDSTSAFPFMMTLGACSDDSLVYEVASAIGKECRRLGIHLNFAPVLDINNNPRNPVINSRSLGEDRQAVTRKGMMYIRGLQDQNIFYTAKHFPGHGDTESDSHLTLPVINHTLSQLDSIELYPYHQLIPQGLEGIMVAHLFVPALDSSKNQASSISKPIITGLLREKMGFNGIVMTDALEMKGITLNNQPGDIELKALLAGNDIVLMPQDVNKTVEYISQAIKKGIFPTEELDKRCLKVLELKHKYIPNHKPAVKLDNLIADLNPFQDRLLYRKIIGAAATLVTNEDGFVPLRVYDTSAIASVCLGTNQLTPFQEMLDCYHPVSHFSLPSNASRQTTDSLLLQLKKYPTVIAAFVNTTSLAEKGFGMSPNSCDFVSRLISQNKVILVHFGNPYGIAKVSNVDSARAVIVGYQDVPDAYTCVAQQIFGAKPFHGKLPVTVSGSHPVASGIETSGQQLLSFVYPEEAGLDGQAFLAIDSLIQQGIDKKAYPGCEVLLSWNGKVVYHKSFGNRVYGDSISVKKDDIYDLASVTKVATTTLAVMKLYEEGKIDLDRKLSTYLPYYRKSNKKNLVIRDILTHQARLQPWIPFYNKVLRDGKPDARLFRKVPDAQFSIQVADSMFLRSDYPDSLRLEILKSPLEKKSQYKYSDLGFYLMKELMEAISHQPLDQYVHDNFYQPLGLRTIGFNPVRNFSKKRIIPTELDTFFRRQLILGYVHDQGAALLGGVSGHAGLFSDALDLGILLEMLLNKGEYDGHRYLKAETVEEFTRVQFPELDNRRGLGFDKPPLHPVPNGPAAMGASSSSFGHSGFTGTYIWADPQDHIGFVFLSNRVYPSAANHELADLNTRTKILDCFYQIVRKAEKAGKE